MGKEGLEGFCMALADSVPGVSGGTVAFIMGFYDRFIGSIHNIVFGKAEKKKESVRYLLKLGVGWVIGMALAALVLSSLFESHIYVVSSLFIGFIAGAIPLIIKEEKENFCQIGKGVLFLILGVFVVVGITWINGRIGNASVHLSNFSIGLGLKLFVIGMCAISAMFLPGISGSTLLLVFGVYMPIINAVKGLLHLDISYIPSLVMFGGGILVGALTVVRIIRLCLEKFRVQTVYLILGMMIGSFYAIIMGPTTLERALPAMNMNSFHVISCILGFGLVLAMQMMKERSETSNLEKGRMI